MLTRRQLLERSLKGASLVALGSTVPSFVTRTAQAAQNGKETILVVLELTGGNDGLNTVIPFADDHYHKARPKLRFEKKSVVPLDDHIGLHPALLPLEGLWNDGELAVVQGVGYPNPNRSHFESMDIWHTADPARKLANGWLGRGLTLLKVQEGRIPAFHIGGGKLPLALQGSAAGVPSMHPSKPLEIRLSGASDEEHNHLPTPAVESVDSAEKPAPDKDAPRRRLIRELAAASAESGDALQFVRRTALQTYTSIDRLREIVYGKNWKPDGQFRRRGNRFVQVQEGLQYELSMVARMIQAGFGTRIFYVSMDGFDTHSGQASDHQKLLADLASAVQQFFGQLQGSGDHKRVLLMTFSEFGRRVRENGSEGTDHGAASCLFLAGPAVKGGLVGKHPSLDPEHLAGGDLQHHTDFRQIYATLLDGWLKGDSRRVLGEKFEHVDVLRKA